MPNSNPNEVVCAHIWASGRVQGVGFRAFVQQWGSRLGLVGWVKNVGSDTVEALGEGHRGIVERFVEIIRAGPQAARVDTIRVDWEEPHSDLDRFQVRF